MSDASPWVTLAIGLAVSFALILFCMLVLKIVEVLHDLRDELRDRYCSTRFQPATADFIAMPLWLTLEVVCFATRVVLGLLLLLVAYQAAKGARDWWHAGSRGR